MHTRTYDLAGEVERLTDEMLEWAEKQAATEFGSEAAKRIEYEGSTLERYRAGVKWAESEFGTEQVELRPLTDGSRRAVRDLTEQTGFDRDQAIVAVGSVDAPYVAHNPGALGVTEDVQATLGNIADLHPGYVDWANERIQDLGSMGDSLGNSYLGMLLEMQAQAANPETTGSDTAE